MTIKIKVAVVASLAGVLALTGCSRRAEATRTRPARRGRLLRPRGGQRARRSRPSRRPTTARTSPSRRRTAPRATRAARSRAASTPTSSTSRSSPTSRGSSTPAWSPRTGRTTTPRASPPRRSCRSWSARATRRTSRPGTTWSSRASRSSRPNPASSGSARWNILAALGHVLANGGTEAEAEEYITKLLKNTISLPGLRPRGHHGVLRGQRRRAALLRERGDPGQAERRAVRLRRPDGHAAHREPGGGHRGRRRRGPGLLRLPAHPGGPGGSTPHFGFRPVVDGVDLPEVEGANDPADPFPATAKLLTIDDDFGGWAEANTKFFDEENGIIPKLQAEDRQGIRNDRRSPICDAVARPARTRRPGGRRRHRTNLTRSSSLALGIAVTWFSLLVLIPLAAIVAVAAGGGWDAFVSDAHQRRRRWRRSSSPSGRRLWSR